MLYSSIIVILTISGFVNILQSKGEVIALLSLCLPAAIRLSVRLTVRHKLCPILWNATPTILAVFFWNFEGVFVKHEVWLQSSD